MAFSNQYSSIPPDLITRVCRECPVTDPPRLPGPVSVILIVTNHCNLRCVMCEYWKYPPGKGELSFEQLIDAVDQFNELGVRRIVLTGGEPLVRKDTLDLCDHIVEKGIDLLLLTNATLIDASRAARIASQRAMRTIISWDGWDVESFDTICGSPGTYDRVKRAFDLLCIENGSGDRVGVNITVTPDNIFALEQIIRLIGGYGIGQLHLHLVYSRSVRFMFDSDQVAAIPEISDRAEEVAREVGIRRVINQIPYAFVQTERCFIPYSFTTLGAKGEVYGCIPAKGGFKDDTTRALGSILERPFVEIWCSSQYDQFRYDAVHGLHKECIACLACHSARQFTSGPCATCSQRPQIALVQPVE